MPTILGIEPFKGGCKISIDGTRKSDIDYVRSVIRYDPATENGVWWQIHEPMPTDDEVHVFVEDRAGQSGRTVLVCKDVEVPIAIAKLFGADAIEMTIQLGRKRVITLTNHSDGQRH